MHISENLRERLVAALTAASSKFYDDSNGPWGHECPFCCKRSIDGSSPPPHDDDCEAMVLIKELQLTQDPVPPCFGNKLAFDQWDGPCTECKAYEECKKYTLEN